MGAKAAKGLQDAKIAASTREVGVGLGPGNGWLFSSCPHCQRGDLFRETWSDSWTCLACGFDGPTALGGVAPPREGQLPIGRKRMALRT